MGLYLCIFDASDEELDGLEVGSYADFEAFRQCVTQRVEDGASGSIFPTLINHSDCDGEWTPEECVTLKRELATITDQFRQLPAIPFAAEWQRQVAAEVGLKPQTLYESFIDVDGEPLLERLIDLCEMSIKTNNSILFQ